MQSWLSPDDLTAFALTLKLAAVTVAILIVLGSPLAWWLARTRWRGKAFIEAVVALPLVLPPTVLGFYLLVLLGPKGWLGGGLLAAGLPHLPFTFTRPGDRLGAVFPALRGAAAAGCVRRDRAAPAGSRRDPARRALGPFLQRGAAAGATRLSHRGDLAFAHTVGEFGVVLMIGGNIPGETRVVSIAIYDHVAGLRLRRRTPLVGTAAGIVVRHAAGRLRSSTAACGLPGA